MGHSQQFMEKLTEDERKLYKIVYEDNSNEGKLYFLEGKLDVRAINNFDSHLEPVCDIENFENRSNATRIQLINNGVVKFMNDKWTIVPNKKVKIRLI